MSATQVLPDMDDTDLLHLLLQDQDGGPDEAFCPEDWLPDNILSSLDTEDFLSSLLGEDEMESHSPLGSDSGISDVPLSCSPGHSDIEPVPGSSPGPPDSILHMVMDTSAPVEVIREDHCYSIQSEPMGEEALQSVRADKPDMDVFIDFEDWDTDAVVEEDDPSEVPCMLAIEDPSLNGNASQFHFKEIVLTDEEKRLLAKEGATLPSHLPLTKAEERTLKRVRRKIRNKQSAQESRKKKKVYVDGLENRVAVCTAQNQQLQIKVHELQKQNVSLIEQVRKLQALIKLSTMKTSSAGTCLMVFLLSFCLIVFPSFNPFGSRRGQGEVYAPSGVLSRTIRSLPAVDTEDVVSSAEVLAEENLVPLVLNAGKLVLPASQNHTPDFQTVEQPESESAVNANSSSDFPVQSKSELRASEITERDGTLPPIDHHGTVSKESWQEQKETISVIIQTHRSDEM